MLARQIAQDVAHVSEGTLTLCQRLRRLSRFSGRCIRVRVGYVECSAVPRLRIATYLGPPRLPQPNS